MNLSSNCVKRIQYYEGRNQKSWKYCGIYCIKTMETSCVSCKKNTANKNKSKFIKTEEVHYVVFCNFNNIWNDWLKINKSCKKNTANKNKSKFIKTGEVHYVVFCNFNNIWNDWLKMNKTVNKFLLAGDKFMSKLHLRQPGFT